MTRSRRALIAALAAGGLVAACPRAQERFPAHPVRILVPFSVGLGPDVLMRVLAERLSRLWGQPVIIENRPGASGTVAMLVGRAAPRDGRTLVLGEAGSLAVMPLLQKVGYDPLTDFEPLTTVFRATFALVTGAASRFPDMATLIAQARTGAGRVSYASLGNGHASQVAVEMLAERVGATFHHVPFRDGGQLLSALAQGEVDFTAISMNSAASFVKAGRLRPLAVAASRRLADWPEVPTLAQAGGPAVEMTPWAALMLPAGAPVGVADTLRHAIAEAQADPATKARIESMGFDVVRSTPAQLIDLIRAETELARRLIRLGRIATS